MRQIQPFRNIALRAVTMLTLFFVPALASAQIYFDFYNFSGSDGEIPAFPQVMAQGQDGNLYGTIPESLGGSGVAFRVTTAGVLTPIHNFGGANGVSPYAGLTLGLDGNFYGSTILGGDNSLGTVFKMTSAGTVTTLYSFKGGTDGAYPYGTPVLGNDGNLYGVTQLATSYRFTPAGVFTTLGTIPSKSFAPLFLGTDGNFYGTSQSGGTFNAGTVFRMTPAGTVSTVYSFDDAHGSDPWGGVVQAGDGNFYGTARSGGSGGGGVVFRVTPSGSIKVLHNFPVGTPDDGTDPMSGLVLATDGTFYGNTFGGGTDGFGVIFQQTPTGAYSFINQNAIASGGNPQSAGVQHTNGWVFGLADGGIHGDGVFYGLDLHLGNTVKLLLSSGKVGSTVQMLGGGFTGTTAVKFNGKSATFTVVSDTFMTAVVPAGATSGLITVTTPTGTAKSQTKFLVVPKLISFSPTSGSVGTAVVIKGNSFTGATRVAFGGVSATTFTVDSDTQITATVPTGALTGKISVTTPGGTATSATTFTVM